MAPTGTLTRPPATGRPPGRPPGRRPEPPPRPRPAPTGRRKVTRRPSKPAEHRLLLGRRVRFLRLLLVMALLAVAARLVDIQVLRSSHYRSAASQELTETVAIPALRGGLYDRNGAVLAESVPTKEVIADDFQIHHPDTEAQALAPLLGLPATQLAGLLSQRSGYVPLVRQLPTTTGTKVSQANFPGVTVVDSSQRVVPNGSLAGSILGLTNAAQQGAAGLEYEYNEQLGGHPGRETLLVSPSGVTLPQSPVEDRTAAVAGKGLELTLDEPLQYAAEQALGAQISATNAVSGTAVVMDVRTGDILAMANLVSTAPGAGTGPAPAGHADAVAQAPTNLALSQLYEPGSVFKLVPFSAALTEGVISPTTEFSVPDHLQLDGSTFHDAEPHATEELNATQILAQSSNIGTSEIASDVGETRLLGQVQALGFGAPTGLHFPGESPGLLAGARQWEPTNIVSLPIGQVDAVNAQQVLDAYNAVANGGVFVAPRLVRATVAGDRVAATPASATRRVMPASVDLELRSMLEQVVDSGTGTSAVVPGYTVAGKTGTAQIPQPGHDSYIQGAYMASFVGFAPADNPVLSAIVVLNRPTPIFGGTVAAPVFSQIMSYALHRYGIPTTPGAPSQGQSQGGSTAASQAQDIT